MSTGNGLTTEQKAELYDKITTPRNARMGLVTLGELGEADGYAASMQPTLQRRLEAREPAHASNIEASIRLHAYNNAVLFSKEPADHLRVLTDLDWQLGDAETIAAFERSTNTSRQQQEAARHHRNKHEPKIYYQGPLTEAQNMAIRKLEEAGVIDCTVLDRRPAGDQFVIINAFNPEKLTELAEKEPQRRKESHEAAETLTELSEKAGLQTSWLVDSSGMRILATGGLAMPTPAALTLLSGALSKAGAVKIDQQLVGVDGEDLHPAITYVTKFDLAKLREFDIAPVLAAIKQLSVNGPAIETGAVLETNGIEVTKKVHGVEVGA